MWLLFSDYMTPLLSPEQVQRFTVYSGLLLVKLKSYLDSDWLSSPGYSLVHTKYSIVESVHSTQVVCTILSILHYFSKMQWITPSAVTRHILDMK